LRLEILQKNNKNPLLASIHGLCEKSADFPSPRKIVRNFSLEVRGFAMLALPASF